MGPLSTTLLAIALVGVVFVVLPIVLDVYYRFRDRRIVRCPETGGDAEVGVDAWHAAATAIPGPPRLHVTACTLWPERAHCAERCVAAR
jgi:hypothetical protein